jgi:AcrR family transcriptional regulator
VPSTKKKAPARRSEARDRLLAAATELFYSEGINTVGVDRIVAAANVTLATFYRHFPSKEDLVVGYLEGVHEHFAGQAAALDAKGLEGREQLTAIGEEVVAEIGSPGYRGCAFLNAASEFEDPESPVRRVVQRHREWFYERLRRAFKEAGHDRPGNAARHFVMLRDGAVAAAYLDSAAAAQRNFRNVVKGLLWSIDLDVPDSREEF